MKQKSLALTTLATVTALVLAGCSGGGSDTSSQEANTSTTTETVESSTGGSESAAQTSESSSPAPTSSGTQMLGTAASGSTTLNQSTIAELVVSDIRVAHHEGFDRVVFEFTGNGAPGYYIGFVDEPRQQASGHPVEVGGEAYLEVNIEGTPMGMGDPNSPWVQPGSLGLSTGKIADVSHGAVFEGQSQYFIGLDSEHPYSVTVLEDPTRLVIDIAD